MDVTLYDLLASGCQFEGWLKISTADGSELFEGVGDELCYPYEDWCDRHIAWIYFNKYENCLCIELN